MALDRRYAIECDNCGRVPSDAHNLRGYATPREARLTRNTTCRRLTVITIITPRRDGWGGSFAQDRKRNERYDLCDRCQKPDTLRAFALAAAARVMSYRGQVDGPAGGAAVIAD